MLLPFVVAVVLINDEDDEDADVDDGGLVATTTLR